MTLVASLLLVLAVLSLNTVQAASVYTIPDRTYLASPNKYSMTVHNGNPVLSYYSQTIQALAVTACANPACTNSTIYPVEAVIPQAVSVTMVNGNPLVVYSQNVSALQSLLKVAVCSDPACAQAPTIRTLDADHVIQNLDVTLQNGLPIIAYDEVTSGNTQNVVRLALCTDATCSAAPILRAFNDTAGINSILGLGVELADGNPVVGYATRTGGLKLLICMTSTCSDTPLIQTIQAEGTNTFGLSMTVIDGTVVMSYAAIDPPSPYTLLKVAACTDLSCMSTMSIRFLGHQPPSSA